MSLSHRDTEFCFLPISQITVMDLCSTRSLDTRGEEGLNYFGSWLSLQKSPKLLSLSTPAVASVFTQLLFEYSACHYISRLFILSCLRVWISAAPPCVFQHSLLTCKETWRENSMLEFRSSEELYRNANQEKIWKPSSCLEMQHSNI